jgi:hypothetical protein
MKIQPIMLNIFVNGNPHRKACCADKVCMMHFREILKLIYKDGDIF